MIQAFVVDSTIMEKIEAVKKYAIENPFTLEQIKAIAGGDESIEIAGDNKNLVLLIPVDYKVVYSIEEQPAGNCRHISISMLEKGRWPNAHVVDEILELYEFRLRIIKPGEKLVGDIWMDDATQSVNIVELI